MIAAAKEDVGQPLGITGGLLVELRYHLFDDRSVATGRDEIGDEIRPLYGLVLEPIEPRRNIGFPLALFSC